MMSIEEYNTVEELIEDLRNDYLYLYPAETVDRKEGIANTDFDEYVKRHMEKYVNSKLADTCWKIVDKDTNKLICWALNESEADIYIEELNNAETGRFFDCIPPTWYVYKMIEVEEMTSQYFDFLYAWDDGGKAVERCPHCDMGLFDDDLPF